MILSTTEAEAEAVAAFSPPLPLPLFLPASSPVLVYVGPITLLTTHTKPQKPIAKASN